MSSPANFISKAHYLMHSAEYEGQPFAPLEAFSAGLPVIADDALIAYQPELSPGMIPYSTDQRDPKILRDPEFHAAKSTAAQELYKAQFSIDVILKNTLGFYSDIIQSTRS